LHINAEWREILRIFWYLPLPLISPLSSNQEIEVPSALPSPPLHCVAAAEENQKESIYIYLVEDEVSAVVSGDLCDLDNGEV
jgi:hypothetical protein